MVVLVLLGVSVFAAAVGSVFAAVGGSVFVLMLMIVGVCGFASRVMIVGAGVMKVALASGTA